jgi:hypothetical protein
MDPAGGFVVVRIALVLALAALALACAGQSFQAARQDDTAAAYHRFLREHPGTRYEEEARQRLELARIRQSPRLADWEAFRGRWPDSRLLPELRALVEAPLFEQTRARGSVDAYREFLADFDQGPHAARARGNLVYLEAGGFAGDPARLAAFAREHPDSDFAAEAERSASTAAARSQSSFRQVGLAIEISPETPGRERLARVFAERAQESLARAGVQVVPLTSRGGAPPARLTIRHSEQTVTPQLEQGRVSAAGVLARTQLELVRSGAAEPVWSRTTELRAAGPAGVPDSSLLFAPEARAFWSEFFVPVVSWNTRAALRRPLDCDAPVVAVEADGTRGVVLFQDGSFQIFDLADPERPWLLATWERPRELARFEGVRAFGDRVVVYGPDGVEVVALAPAGPEPARRLDRAAVGSVLAVEWMGDVLVAAGSRGLLVVPADGEPRVLLARPMLGLARVGERVVFGDGASIYVATLRHLADGVVESELALDPGLRAGAIRATGGGDALVLSERGVLRLDLSNPAAPRALARVDASETGAVEDGLVVGGRVFLLGERGLQLADAQGVRVVDSVDVAARARMDVSGRHLLMVGDHWLQVVDTTPLVAGTAVAAPVD